MALAMVLIAGPMIFYGDYILKRSIKSTEDIDASIRVAFILNTLTHDLANNPSSERVQTQWKAAYKKYTVLIDRISQDLGSENNELERILSANKQLEYLNDKLIISLDRLRQGETTQILENRILSVAVRMVEEMEVVATITNQLHRKTQLSFKENQQIIHSVILAIAVIAGIVVTLFSWLLSRGINQRISLLKGSIHQIAQGRLDVQLLVQSNDELDQLVHDFNHMSTRLRTTLASRDELNHEVELRREAERILRRSEATSRSLLESTAEGIVGTDEHGVVTFVNPAATRLLEYSSEELLGQSLHELVHHSHSDGSPYPEEECPMIQTIQTGELHQVNDEYLWLKNGTCFPVTYSSSPIYRDGKVVGAVVAFTDITHIKQAEKEIAEARVAGESNKLKRTFLANVTHELRTPLNVILGMEHALGQEKLTRKQKESVQKINRACRQLNQLIEGMLDFSRLDSGTARLKLAPTSLTDLFHVFTDMIKEKIEQKGLRLHLRISDEVPICVLADGGRIIDVLTYLTDNAIKFTQTGSVTLSCSSTVVREGSCRIVMTVEDTGIGMQQGGFSLDGHDFSQEEQSRSRQYSGIGMGLTLSRHIVKMMDGILSFDSERGRGTTARIELILQQVRPEEYAKLPFEVDRLQKKQPETEEEIAAPCKELAAENVHRLKEQLDMLIDSVNRDYPKGLSLSMQLLEEFEGTDFHDALKEIKDKVDAFETEEVVEKCRKLQQQIVF